jgi:hypothetical protein
MYRQGDVLLVPVETIPSDAKRVPAPIILAHGEATGHAHEIKSRNAKLFESTGKRFLRLTKTAILEHQEHDPVTLPSGDYEVIRQREYHPEEIRNVAD